MLQLPSEQVKHTLCDFHLKTANMYLHVNNPITLSQFPVVCSISNNEHEKPVNLFLGKLSSPFHVMAQDNCLIFQVVLVALAVIAPHADAASCQEVCDRARDHCKASPCDFFFDPACHTACDGAHRGCSLACGLGK